MASSSSSSSRPHNLLTLFQAHFHVRRGNEVTYQHGHELDLSGVEWKALPSGSHALHRDLIWFHTPGQREETVGDEGERYHRVGVAAFVNRKLGGSGSGADNDEGEDNEDEDDQRGARMIAVGIIALASSSTPSAHLAACLPHINALESLAAQSASRPRDHKSLDAFLDAYRFNPSASEYDLRSSLESIETLRIPAPLSRRAISPADPLLDLPAVVNALGLLLPQLLRKLLVRGTRLVIFCPLGAQTRTAAAIAWALAEVLEAALHVDDDEVAGYQDEEEDDDAAAQRLRHRRRLRIPQVRGIIGLQDLALLQEEQRRAPLPQGWISWTTDKLLLEKPDLYDCLLDLSPLFPAAQQHQAAAASTSAASSSSSSSLFAGPTRDSSPNLYRVERLVSTDKKGRTTAKLKRVPWLPRDFALARSNEHRSVRLASRPRSLARRGSRSSVRFTPSDDGGERARIRHEASEALKGPQSSFGQQLAARDGSSRSPVALLAHLLAFLRYWVSSLSFIPQQWRINLRESYGYVPLSIRPDGGVQAGLMLLPDSDESESEGNGSDGESEDDEEGDEAEERADGDAGASSSSPRSRRASRLSSTTGSSRRLRVPTSSTTGGIALTDDPAQDDFFTNPSVSPRLTAVDDDDHIDPLLAACGVHSPAASRSGGAAGGAGGGSVRRSGSRSRQASAAGSVAKDVLVGTDDTGAGAEGGQTGGSSSSAASPSSQKHLTPPAAAAAAKSASASSSSVGGQLVPPSPTPNPRRRKRTTSQDVHRDTRLARAIFTIWAEWLRELVLDLEALAVTPAAGGYEDDRAAADKPIDGDEQDDDRAELLPSSSSRSSSSMTATPNNKSSALPPLTSRQLSALGLNSRNEEDRLLVVDMTEGRREVVAGWRFWGNWF